MPLCHDVVSGVDEEPSPFSPPEVEECLAPEDAWRASHGTIHYMETYSPSGIPATPQGKEEHLHDHDDL